MKYSDRRQFIAATALVATVGLAGCTDDADDIDDDLDDDLDDEEVGVADDEDDIDDDEEIDDDEDDVDDDEDDVDDDVDNDVDDDAEGRVDEYLTENDARLYEGDIEDNTGEDEVTIAVGAGDEGFAFDPPATRIDAGATIVWEWTGEGGGHNVVPDGDTDFDDFGEEEIIDSDDHEVEETFEEEGVGLYVCEPHAGVGMFGGFIVED